MQASLELKKRFLTFFNIDLVGLFQNVQLLNPRWSESSEIKENKVGNVLWDTLYDSRKYNGLSFCLEHPTLVYLQACPEACVANI